MGPVGTPASPNPYPLCLLWFGGSFLSRLDSLWSAQCDGFCLAAWQQNTPGTKGGQHLLGEQMRTRMTTQNSNNDDQQGDNKNNQKEQNTIVFQSSLTHLTFVMQLKALTRIALPQNSRHVWCWRYRLKNLPAAAVLRCEQGTRTLQVEHHLASTVQNPINYPEQTSTKQTQQARGARRNNEPQKRSNPS